jgi:hypothetical protein
MTSLYSSTGHGVGLVVIDNGTLRISDDDGSRIARLNKYIANGWIQAVAGKSLLITRDGAHDILAAVNEPGIANTLKNPSFDTEGTNASSAQSWLAGNDNVFRTSEISARSGSWVMKINDSQQGTCFQNFPGAEIAGKKFIASVWAQYTDATFTTRGCIEIEFLQSGSAIAGIPVYFLDSNDPINTWKYYRIAAIAPAEATGVRLRLMNKGGSGELGTVYFDDAYFACTDMQQDLNDDKAVNFKDLFYLTNNWLDSNFLNDVQQPFVTDNFENYNSFDNLAYVWDYEPPWAPGTSTISLITDAGSAHSGSKAMSWQYDVTTNGIGELWAEIDSWNMTPVNVSLFDELHVWVNRHPGNSTESIFYLKFYQGGTDAENVAADAHIPDTEGSSSSPTGWTEWVINLHKDLIYFHAGYSKLSDLDDVRCILFGVDSKPGHIGGTGTIDIDDMVFVDYTPSCASNPAGDLNSDCIVNFEDIAVFAVNWMAIEL